MNLQPNSRMCFACGMENQVGLKLRFFDDGHSEVWADFVLPDVFQGYPNVAHGGVVAAILDEVGGRTVMIGDPLRLFVTARLDIHYRRPVPTGKSLRAVGRLLSGHNSCWRAHAAIQAPNGEVLAEADLLLTLPPSSIFTPSEADRLGWRIYEEER